MHHLLHNIDPFAFVSQLEKNSKTISRPGLFFICQMKWESFGFAIFITNWFSYSRLLMTPRNFTCIPILLDSCLCCYSPSLLGHPQHWAVQAAQGMATSCRTKMSSCLRCYSCSEPVLLIFLCFQLHKTRSQLLLVSEWEILSVLEFCETNANLYILKINFTVRTSKNCVSVLNL